MSGRVCRPISSTSSNPFVAIRAVRTPFRSRRAFVATVDPWTTLFGPARSVSCNPASTASAGLRGVESTLCALTRPSRSTRKSVNVPPVSIPTLADRSPGGGFMHSSATIPAWPLSSSRIVPVRGRVLYCTVIPGVSTVRSSSAGEMERAWRSSRRCGLIPCGRETIRSTGGRSSRDAGPPGGRSRRRRTSRRG